MVLIFPAFRPWGRAPVAGYGRLEKSETPEEDACAVDNCSW